MPILPSFCGAGVEGPTIVGEWENTGLPVGIATISLGHSCLLAADSIAQASAQHLLVSLRLQPLHSHRVDHTAIRDTVAVWSGLQRSLRLVNRCSDICEGARSS